MDEFILNNVSEQLIGPQEVTCRVIAKKEFICRCAYVRAAFKSGAKALAAHLELKDFHLFLHKTQFNFFLGNSQK